MTENEELADALEPYFRSGNAVPVSHAHIPAELARRVIEALRAIPVAASKQEVERLGALIRGTQPEEREREALRKLIAAWHELPTFSQDESSGYTTFDQRGRAFFDAAIAVVKSSMNNYSESK